MMDKNKQEKHSIIKGSKLSKEETYFAEQEAKLLKEYTKSVENKVKEQEVLRLAEEKKKLKELHYMKCPKCGMELMEVNYMDVLVDICEECLGIWLDHGELESIMLKQEGFMGKLFRKVGIKNEKSPVNKKK